MTWYHNSFLLVRKKLETRQTYKTTVFKHWTRDIVGLWSLSNRKQVRLIMQFPHLSAFNFCVCREEKSILVIVVFMNQVGWGRWNLRGGVSGESIQENNSRRTSLVIQWMGICPAMQGTGVWSLAKELRSYMLWSS